MSQKQPDRISTHAGVILWHGEHGIPHCNDGPAIEFPNGDKEWWVHGELHRDDGPAVLRADGTKEWWLRGQPWPEGPEESLKNQQKKISQKNLENLKSVIQKNKKPTLKNKFG